MEIKAEEVAFILDFDSLPVRRGGLRTRPQRWRVATAGWVALQAG